MKIVNMHKAKTYLSRLIQVVSSGQEIIIAKGGVPQAKIVPLTMDVSLEDIELWDPNTEDDFSITQVNAMSNSFSWLDDEPDLYSIDDAKERYV